MIGRVFAQRYRLEEFIGKGGMALVFRATDLRTGHDVAVKILRPEFNNDKEFLERFEREALAASKMSHHNIVNLLDVGQEEGYRYLVMEYMRGRTLNDSFIILDEAQNTSCEQMKMFLTRMGFNSKMVITGDVTQIDLPSDKPSGLKEALRILDGIDDIAICRLTGADVVRHALVQKIIAAYEQDDKQREKHAAAAAKKPAARKTTVRKKA